MDNGLGAAVGLWVIFGAAFWSGFVALGFRFRSADEPDDARAPAIDETTPRHASPRAAPDHIAARSRR